MGDGRWDERESGEERSERRRSLQVNTPYWRARIFFKSRLAPPGTKKGKGRNFPMGHTTDTTLESTNDGHVTQSVHPFHVGIDSDSTDSTSVSKAGL